MTWEKKAGTFVGSADEQASHSWDKVSLRGKEEERSVSSLLSDSHNLPWTMLPLQENPEPRLGPPFLGTFSPVDQWL